MADKVRKNRCPRGEQHGMAKLTEREVSQIKKLARKGVKTIQLANKFNISWTQAKDIVAGRSWKHVI